MYDKNVGLFVREVKSSYLKKETESLIFFGSRLYENNSPKSDHDLCVVLLHRDKQILDDFKKILDKYFDNLDLTIYYHDEIDSSLPFRDIGMGVFALHYLALGKALIGKNIFKSQLKKISPVVYKHSLKEKIYDYVLRLRRMYISNTPIDDKLIYFEKYLSRLIIDLILYYDLDQLEKLINFNPEEVFSLGEKLGIVKNPSHLIDNKFGKPLLLDNYFKELDQISRSLAEI